METRSINKIQACLSGVQALHPLLAFSLPSIFFILFYIIITIGENENNV